MTAQITRIRSRAARIDIRATLLQRVALFEAGLDGGYGIAQPNIESRVPEAGHFVLSELGTVAVGDRVGDVPPVVRASPRALFDLDAVCSAGGEPVDDVLQAITAELLVWGRDVHRYIRAGGCPFDGSLDVLLQPDGRSATDEDVEGDFGVVEAMEGDRISEAPKDDQVQQGETRTL